MASKHRDTPPLVRAASPKVRELALGRGTHNQRKAMGWFSGKTSIAGVQIPNLMLVLCAILIILLIYNFMQEAQLQR